MRHQSNATGEVKVLGSACRTQETKQLRTLLNAETETEKAVKQHRDTAQYSTGTQRQRKPDLAPNVFYDPRRMIKTL
jgi:hypothetical protein